MKFIKLGLISFVVLFMIVTAFSLLLPSKVVVSRATDLRANKDSVHAYMSNLNTWNDWLAIGPKDSLIASGQALQWNNTTITVTEKNPEQINSVWQIGQGRPMSGEFNFISSGDSSIFTLQWAFIQDIKWYPWEKFASIFSDNALGPLMEKSLDKLKVKVENQPFLP